MATFSRKEGQLNYKVKDGLTHKFVKDRPFPPPSRPPSHLRQTQEQEQGRQPHALRLQPPLRPELPGGGAARGRRTRAAAGGLCASHPQARRCRRAAARVPALAPASLPREETKGRFSRVTARPLTGKQSRPRRGRPPHKGAPRLGRGVGALVPAPRAGSHPPAGVCASVHRNAVGGGACESRAARAGRDGPEGREGGRRAARGPGTEGVEPAIPAMVRGSVQHRSLLHVLGPRSPMPPGALCTSTETQGAERTYTIREVASANPSPSLELIQVDVLNTFLYQHSSRSRLKFKICVNVDTIMFVRTKETKNENPLVNCIF
ncbi:uncharacterized protein LOC129043684 [Pongo pygmaeus]|uniref:uncharacterized protein LOC129043684 n=1 Tax=Pongo pygmaeus TaxID=9600 RepID=UPI00300C396F